LVLKIFFPLSSLLSSSLHLLQYHQKQKPELRTPLDIYLPIIYEKKRKEKKRKEKKRKIQKTY